MTQSYANGKIYKIVNKNDPEEFYVGSTKNHLRVRWQGHKHTSKRSPNQLIYQRMNEIGFECFHIVLIEDYPCDNKDQLRQREDFWICELKPKLNKYRAYLSDDEKKDYNKINSKEWRLNNKDKAKEHNTEYYSNNKEKCNEQNRLWRESNRDQVNERMKRYYESNQELIKTKKKEKAQCDN